MRKIPKGTTTPMHTASLKHATQKGRTPTFPTGVIEQTAKAQTKQTSTTIKKARNP